MTNEDAKQWIENLIKTMRMETSGPCSDPSYKDEVYVALKTAIKALEQEPCDDCISRQSVKRKLQEHHDFFIHAYGGFSNMPQNDKSRVDEIINCIAMVVNEPSVTPKEKTGRWKVQHTNLSHLPSDTIVTCLECGHTKSRIDGEILNFCPKCGARMMSK